MTHKLTTTRLVLKQISESDWPLFLRLHDEPEVLRYTFDRPSDDAIRQKFEDRLPFWAIGDQHTLCLVIYRADNHQPVGVSGFTPCKDHPGQVEFGYLFLPEHHGKGYATEALQVIVDYALTLRFNTLTATVTDGNIASCKVLEKCGFSQVRRAPKAYRIKDQVYDDLIFERRA